jgi:hypothetical protein
MLQPTLIVGLGSSGVDVVNEVQRWMYSTFGVNRLPIFRYVCIDTDATKSEDRTPAGSDVNLLQLKLDSYERAINDLKRNPKVSLDWISPQLPSQMAAKVLGAGGVRPAGRLVLWGDGNFGSVYRALENAWQDVVRPNAAQELDALLRPLFNPTPVVYVVGTLGGGTGSGTFIDIGYMLQQICGSPEAVDSFGVFFIPRQGVDKILTYGNSYGALKELGFFQEGGVYEETWPYAVPTQRRSTPPFRSAYIVSPEYGHAEYGTMEYERCLKLLGLVLFCDLIGMSGYRQADLINARNAGLGYYWTLGISAVIYPKYTILESGACVLALGLCDRWEQTQTFWGPQDQALSISDAEIHGQTLKFINSCIEHAFGILGTSQGRALNDRAIDAVDQIIRKEQPDPRLYLTGLLSAGRTDNFFATVEGNIPLGEDYLIREISQFIGSRLNESQNLEYTRSSLRMISSVIDQTATYWETGCKVPADVNEWNEFVSTQVGRLLEHQNVVFLSRRDTLLDGLEELLKKLKMFVLRRSLKALGSDVQTSNRASLDGRTMLPTVESIERMEKAVKAAAELLSRRKQDLDGEIRDIYMPIHRVWSLASYEKDLDNIASVFQQNQGKPHYRQIVDHPVLGGKALWDFLVGNTPQQLFLNMKVAYQARIERYLPKVDVLEAALRDPQQTAQYAQRALSTLVRLDHGTLEEGSIPCYVLGVNEPGLQSLVRGLHTAFKEQNVKTLPKLDHAIVFYKEAGGFKPLDSLSVRQTMQERFETPQWEASGKQQMDPQVWRQHRLAYNIQKRSRISRLRGLVDFTLNFGLVWEKTGTQWKPAKTRWPQLSVSLDTPPVFSYEENGRLWELELDPNNIPRMEQIAERRTNLSAFYESVKAAVGTTTRESLLSIYRTEIRPRMKAGGKSVEQLDQMTDYYFGNTENTPPTQGLIGHLSSGTYLDDIG